MRSQIVMNVRRWLVILVGLGLGVMVGSVVTPAFAQNYFSERTSFSSNGTNYQNGSNVSDSARQSGATVYRISAGTTAVGRMGARARTYFENGDACSIGSTDFNTFAATSWTTGYTYGMGACSGYHYARGATETWNGNGYDFVSTKRTVNVINY